MKPNCLQILREQKDSNLPGGLYHKVQIQMAYHSNRMEGSRLTEEQTRQMFETHTILAEHAVLYVDDIVQTQNHRVTVPPEQVEPELRKLLKQYHSLSAVKVEDIIDFHAQFEMIHPFQDGNGRVGRLIMFKECLKHDIMPFILDEQHKTIYPRG